jgi:hypothetical protein
MVALPFCIDAGKAGCPPVAAAVMRRGDHPPEKRKVDSSILSLTTILMRLEQPSYLH